VALYQRTCQQCGTPFEAKRPQALFCGHVCRNRASRLRAELREDTTPAAEPTPAPARQVLEPSAIWGAEEEPPAGSGWGDEDQPRLITVLTTTHQLLSDQHVLETPLGQAALQLAARLDESHHESGSSMATLAKQLQSTLAAATAAAAKSAEDPMDEIRRRREERRAG
jgi:hypothetical protein